jgi:hypothetical protein
MGLMGLMGLQVDVESRESQLALLCFWRATG